MRLYFLRLARAANLRRAFGVVSDGRGVVSCTVEPKLRQIRFVAPRLEADALVERIYLDGGLVWCSKHTPKSWRLGAKPGGAPGREADRALGRPGPRPDSRGR